MKNVFLKHYLHLLHGSTNRQVYDQVLGFEAMLEGFPGKFDEVSKKCGFDIMFQRGSGNIGANLCQFKTFQAFY